VQYYADDKADISVREMLEREKLGLDEVGVNNYFFWSVSCLIPSTPPSPPKDYDKAFADVMARTSGVTDGDNYDMADMFVDKIAKPVSREKQEARDRQRSIAGRVRWFIDSTHLGSILFK